MARRPSVSRVLAGEDSVRSDASSSGQALMVPDWEKGFQELWQLHGPGLYRNCVGWMAGRVDEAEDAFSRAALLAFEKYSSHGNKVRHPGAWLRRLTFNVCMDLHREFSRQRAWQAADSESIDEAEVGFWGGGGSNPERAYLRDEKKTLLEHCVRSLPERLRMVMEPLIFEGSTYYEIADRLAISEMTLRKRIQEARGLLRQGLSAYQEGKARLAPRRLESRGVDKPNAAAVTSFQDPWSKSKPVAVTYVQIGVDGCLKDVVLFFEEKTKRASARRLASLENYIEKHPSGWKKRLEAARLLRQLGRFQEAEGYYHYVVERQPQRLAAWLELARILLALKRREEALATYRRALQAARRKATRQHLQALIAQSDRCFREAVEALHEAARLEPENISHKIVLCEICLEAGWPLDAVEASEAALATAPDDALLLMLSHDALLAADRPVAAAPRIRRAVELDRSNPLALVRFLDQRSRAGQRTETEGRGPLRRLMSLAPAAAEVHRCRARCHLARGEWEQAEHCLAEYVAKYPTHARGRLYHGQLLEQIGRFGPAEARIWEALELDDSDREIRIAHVRMLARTGPREAAEQALEELFHLFPDDAPVVQMVAEELARLATAPGRVKELLEHATELQPRWSESAFCRGRVLVHLGWIEEATGAFEQGWSLLPADGASPRSAAAALALGECWRRQGKEQQWRSWLRAALEQAEALQSLDPAEAAVVRGEALAGLGERDAALTAFKSALESQILYPRRGEVEEMIAALTLASFSRKAC